MPWEFEFPFSGSLISTLLGEGEDLAGAGNDVVGAVEVVGAGVVGLGVEGRNVELEHFPSIARHQLPHLLVQGSGFMG